MDGPTVTMCMGYTHADLAIMPGTYVARQVGDFIRANLTEYQTMFNKRTFRTEYTVMGKYASWDASSGILHVPIGFARRSRISSKIQGVKSSKNASLIILYER